MRSAVIVGALCALLAAGHAHAADNMDARIDALRALIADDPVDPRLAERLVSLGELLLDRLALDAADTGVLLGAATPDQRARVRRAAEEALERIDEGLRAVRVTIAALEDHPLYAERRELQDLRSLLAVELQEFRAPLARSRARLLLAALERSVERASSAARAAADDVRELDLRDPLAEARRAVTLGLAQMLGGEASSRAQNHFVRALELGGDALRADPRTWVEAVLGDALRAAASGRVDDARAGLERARLAPPFVYEGGEPVVHYQLLAADALFRIGLIEAAGAGAQDTAMRRAFEAYARLLTNGALPVPMATRRALVFERIESALGADAPVDALPPLGIIAHAARLGRDPATRSAGIDALRSLASINALRAVPERAEALLLLATLLIERAATDADPRADEREAMRTLTAIGADLAWWEDAPEAVASAARIALRLSSAGAWDEHVERALRAGLAGNPAHADADRWRLALAGRIADSAERVRLLMEVRPGRSEHAYARALLVDHARQALRDAPAASRRDAALAMLDAHDAAHEAIDAAELSPDDAQRLRARADIQAIDACLSLEREGEALRLAALHADLPGADAWIEPLAAHLRRRVEHAERALDAGAMRELGSMLVEACDLLERKELDADRADRFAATRAQGLIAAGRAPEARGLLVELVGRLGRREDLVLLLAEAELGAGDARAAFARFREVVTPLEARGAYNGAFWRSWSRMLEVLLGQNAGGERTASIRREIIRLRALDADLGGPPHRERIEAVRRAVAGDDPR